MALLQSFKPVSNSLVIVELVHKNILEGVLLYLHITSLIFFRSEVKILTSFSFICDISTTMLSSLSIICSHIILLYLVSQS